MVITVASDEASAIGFSSLRRESGDCSGEPEGPAIQNDSGEIDRRSTEDGLVFAHRIRHCAFDVGHLHCGGIDIELARRSWLNRNALGLGSNAGPGDEYEATCALGRSCRAFRCIVETRTVVS